MYIYIVHVIPEIWLLCLRQLHTIPDNYVLFPYIFLPSAKENVITITVDEFRSNSNSDNGLRLSNGTSPTLSANHNSETETHKRLKSETSITHSYSEVFMNNDSYIAPGADVLLDPHSYDAESGKNAINR